MYESWLTWLVCHSQSFAGHPEYSNCRWNLRASKLVGFYVVFDPSLRTRSTRLLQTCFPKDVPWWHADCMTRRQEEPRFPVGSTDELILGQISQTRKHVSPRAACTEEWVPFAHVLQSPNIEREHDAITFQAIHNWTTQEGRDPELIAAALTVVRATTLSAPNHAYVEHSLLYSIIFLSACTRDWSRFRTRFIMFHRYGLTSCDLALLFFVCSSCVVS